MPSPASPNELTSALEEAQDLARQRELALALRDERIRLRHQHELVARRQRSRRAADLLGLADAIAHSRSRQRDYVIQPREAEISNSAQESPATPEPTQA